MRVLTTIIMTNLIIFFRTLAPFIGLKETDEEEIQEEHSVKAQKIKMMRLWMHRYGDQATYLKFIEGCEQVQRRDLVEHVCDLIQQEMSSGTTGVWKTVEHSGNCVL